MYPSFAKTFCQKNYVTGHLPSERRGGNRKIVEYGPKKDSIMNVLNTFKCVGSHYCRSVVSSRMYLSSDLNIKKFIGCMMQFLLR